MARQFLLKNIAVFIHYKNGYLHYLIMPLFKNFTSNNCDGYAIIGITIREIWHNTTNLGYIPFQIVVFTFQFPFCPRSNLKATLGNQDTPINPKLLHLPDGARNLSIYPLHHLCWEFFFLKVTNCFIGF